MNIILESFYDLKEIVSFFNNFYEKYNWLLSDLDGFFSDKYFYYFIDYRIYNNRMNISIYWIIGEKFMEFVNKEDIYFIWGVFLVFDKKEIINLDVFKEEFYVDGNLDFWIEVLIIQYFKVIIELVFWDLFLILFLSKDEEIFRYFRNKFVKWKDLEEYNNEQFYNLYIL